VFVAFGVPAILLILSVGGLVMPMIWFCAGTAAGVGMVFFFATVVRCSVSATVLAIPAVLIAGTAWINGFLREWQNPPERAERKS
jgi:hypothetical protein